MGESQHQAHAANTTSGELCVSPTCMHLLSADKQVRPPDAVNTVGPDNADTPY
jgi:hypothetical protein